MIDSCDRLRAATTHSGRSAGEEDQLLIANVIKGEVMSRAKGEGGGVRTGRESLIPCRGGECEDR